jgi:hypothetical protein
MRSGWSVLMGFASGTCRNFLELVGKQYVAETQSFTKRIKSMRYIGQSRAWLESYRPTYCRRFQRRTIPSVLSAVGFKATTVNDRTQRCI